MSRPCREFGCPNLVQSRSQKGFYDDHADKRSNWNKRPQPQSGAMDMHGASLESKCLKEIIIFA